jgi:hypothetical protein
VRNLFAVTVVVVLIWVSLFFVPLEPAYASVCQITNVTYSNPSNVDPGQPVTVSATVSGSCAPSDAYYYSARVDITDVSGRIIASNSAPISYTANNGQPFTITVPNQLTAPGVGSWVFQYVVYVYVSAGTGNGVDYQTVQPETIEVGQVTITQTVYNTTTAQATPSLTVTTQTVTQTISLTFSSEQMYPVLAAAFGILFVISLALLIRQRKRR